MIICTIAYANITCINRISISKSIISLIFFSYNIKICYFITMTAPLPSDNFELRWSGTMREAWGDGTVFIQRRVDEYALEAERLARELRAE